MNYGTDQVSSTYIEASGSLIVVGPSAWLGEMSMGGNVPPGSASGTTYDYSF